MNATTEQVGKRGRYETPALLRAIAAALLSAPLSWGIIGVPFQFEYLANDIEFMLFALSVGELPWFFEAFRNLLYQVFRLGFLWGLPTSLLVGIPTYLLFKHHQRVSLADAMIGGLVPGIVVSFLLLPLFLSGIASTGVNDRLSDFLNNAVLLNLQASLTGPIFWLIRRPDRDEPPAHMPQSPTA